MNLNLSLLDKSHLSQWLIFPILLSHSLVVVVVCSVCTSRAVLCCAQLQWKDLPCPAHTDSNQQMGGIPVDFRMSVSAWLRQAATVRGDEN